MKILKVKGFIVESLIKQRRTEMKKIVSIMLLGVIAVTVMGCASKCEVEPIVEENHKLIVPPHFGQMPK